MARDPFEVLFLCTGNSARSIMAESIVNRVGPGRFHARSAGSMPTGRVNPHALALLDRLGYPTADLRSKSWDEFAAEGAPKFDFIITVCDNAAAEVCPIWPGQPARVHWPIPDPAAVEGNAAQIALAFADAYRMLKNQIALFASLPVPSLERLSLRRALGEVGRTGAARSPAH